MEYLDIYDEFKNHLGKETREVVHSKGLWHNTVHCWLYDSFGFVYFQIRADELRFYTTASGHVLAGETIKEGFGREIKEELGIDIEYNAAEKIDEVIWKMDKEKEDGTIFCDRVFANVYVYRYDERDYQKFNFDEEVDGVVKVKAQDALELFKKEHGQITAEIILKGKKENIKIIRDVDFNEFLVNEHETAIEKYGEVLNKIIKKCDIAL